MSLTRSKLWWVCYQENAAKNHAPFHHLQGPSAMAGLIIRQNMNGYSPIRIQVTRQVPL